MKKTNWVFIFTVMSFAIGAPAQASNSATSPTAQTNVGPTAPKPPATLNQRKTDQQDRIAQGVQSGQLTPAETAHIENREVRTNRTEAAMKAANGGTLTSGDKAVLNHQLNHTSRTIYRDKHNSRTR